MSEHEYDVVVVGGGIAGLSAAVSAAEAGARVVLLDRASESETGGNTRYTEAYLRMESLEQTAEGLEDCLLSDFMGHPDPGIFVDATTERDRRPPVLRAHSAIDIDYVETLAANAPTTLQWLTRRGVTFDYLPTPFPTTSTPRMAPVGGGLALVESLGKAARNSGVEFHFRTTARGLVVDDAGTVRGVRVATGTGTAVFTGRVVLACGGFEGNAEMTSRYLGDGALTLRPVARGGYYNKGEGIEMALAVGAATAGNFSKFHAEPVDPRSGQAEAAVFAFPYGILINVCGRRFTDEARGPADAWYERTTREIHTQPQGLAYAVLDADMVAIPRIRAAIRTDQPAITADTIADLAVKLQVPADALEGTINRYNAACGDGTFDHSVPDGLATAGLTPPKSNWARPLGRKPFHAWPVMAANVFTFGGLKTTHDAQVVDRDGEVIDGLYAAGEMTGLYYTNYTGSTSVLRGAVFGRIAGAHAARVAQSAAR